MKTIFTDISTLTKDKPVTFLTEDVVSTGTTFRVQSIAGFVGVSTSSGQIVCIGKLGEERTELLRTSNTTAYNPSQAYKEVTLRDAMVFDHPQDTPVSIVDWNRIDIQRAATVTGAKTTIVASPSYPVYIRPDQLENSYIDTTQTAGYYFVRFNETVGDTNSDWSDAIPFGGFDDNTVAEIKRRAVEELGEEIDGKIITHEFLNKALWQARREYHQAPGKRPFRRKFNTDIGNALTGSFRIELPTDVERPFTAENVYGVRIGAGANMSYYDKKDWDFDFRNKPYTTLAHAYTYGLSTSIWLTNGRDFSNSAVISVEGENIGITRVVSYTGESYQNSFRIYSHPTGGYDTSVGSDVFQNAYLGMPDKFTVWANPEGSAYIYFNRLIDTAYVGQNIYADYYRTLVGYDSDADVLDEPAYDFYVSYLKAKIKAKRNRGQDDMTKDADFKIYQDGLAKALAKEYLSTEIRIFPQVSDFPN